MLVSHRYFLCRINDDVNRRFHFGNGSPAPPEGMDVPTWYGTPEFPEAWMWSLTQDDIIIDGRPANVHALADELVQGIGSPVDGWTSADVCRAICGGEKHYIQQAVRKDWPGDFAAEVVQDAEAAAAAAAAAP